MSRVPHRRCELCDRLYSCDRLSRSRYERYEPGGEVLDQGVICTACWQDLPLTVSTRQGTYYLISRAY